MTRLTTNDTPCAAKTAALIAEHCHETHRGAMRYPPADTDETFCLTLFGNDGYAKRPDSDPVIHARTKAYVHCLYAGLANLLPEGAVEFGTDEHGSTWVILAHFPRHDDHDDYRACCTDDDEADDDTLVNFWSSIVSGQWQSQLAHTQE